ncbi:MAG: prepilin-type N-terminal cleavage/methylation domain-containing protein [Lachnospiraceae bacterium]|nr:prepilin-type N-terminal cleavage/methylation domain-containing protein [Lachnospiraceae bacterium]
MKNNKGFSLVELIIVIAIMAILVGVLAPSLIKQLEKAKVSSDATVCDTVALAFTTAINDCATLPQSAQSATYTSVEAGTDLASLANADSLSASFMQVLGVTAFSDVASSLKSSGATAISIQVDSLQNVKVWIPNTDSTGSKGKGTTAINVISVD